MKRGLKISLAAVLLLAVVAGVVWYSMPIRSEQTVATSSEPTVATPIETPLPEDAVIDRLVVHKKPTHHVGVLERQVAENLSHCAGQAARRA